MPVAPDRSENAASQGPRLTFRGYLEDTDAGGVVYHASYLRFMERARTEALRMAGIEQSESFTRDLSFVVHSMNLRFHTAAVLDSEIAVTCELSGQRGASLEFTQKVSDARSGQLHCSAEVTVACISISAKRPRRIPPDIARRLAEVTGATAPPAIAVDATCS